ncbi:hypothetical protein BWI97_15825 [Siphonobacter sp. BAB-5405]|uniref:hypothetical protein n=1 Tax=Siphonobacter sp. BAB-5405 TaxID=1864825 RepID=UPI000C806FE4|nr:hypothetical protein [Siphonobacter sp. BAB-5405]PMD94864.1 hypothetical protein BWI97_15825 [Siphonobacter sp. BAB-5405]
MKGVQLSLDYKTIMSVGYDQDQMLRDILELHCPRGIDCDATYGYGGFYQTIPRPEHCFDIAPKKAEAIQADSRALPLKTKSIRSLMFDPPFVVSNHVQSETYVMDRKYGGYRSMTQLREHYRSSIKEFARVLKRGGVLIVKCQDQCHGRMNYAIHKEVMDMAEESGFRWVDMFILIARNRFLGAVKKQNHARKFHSYFLIFKRLNHEQK